MPIEAIRANLATAKVGARVSYEGREGVITRQTVRAAPRPAYQQVFYRVLFDDGGQMTTDLRMNGWSLVKSD